jgi:hypothetical protein
LLLIIKFNLTFWHAFPASPLKKTAQFRPKVEPPHQKISRFRFPRAIS